MPPASGDPRDPLLSSATFGDHPGLPDVIPQPANVANPSSSDAPTADPNLICLRPTWEIILSPRPDGLLERISQVRCQILSSVYLKDRFEKVPGHDHWSLAIRLLTHGILSHFFTQELQSYNFMLNGEISSPGRFWWIFLSPCAQLWIERRWHVESACRWILLSLWI